MLYEVFEQHEPVKTTRKDFAGRFVYESDIRSVNVIDVSSDKDPIEYARDRFGIDHPLVSAVNGYDEEGRVISQRGELS